MALLGVVTIIFFAGHLLGCLVLFLSILSVLVQDVKRLDVWFRIPVCLKENVRTFGIKRTDIFIVMKKEGCPYGASLLQYDGNWIIS